MVNRPRQKGTAFETAVVAYLRDHGFPNAERRALRGTKDCGDIAGIPNTVLELKATKTLDLAGALAEAEQEAENAAVNWFVAVIKRRNKPIAQAYVVQTLEQWANEHRSFP